MANDSDNSAAPVKVKVLSPDTDGLTAINTATGTATIYPYGQAQIPYPQGPVMQPAGGAAGVPIVMMPQPSTPPIILLTVEGRKDDKKEKPEVSAVFKRI